jgi:NADH-quinone oxidoreductase subunit D
MHMGTFHPAGALSLQPEMNAPVSSSPTQSTELSYSELLRLSSPNRTQSHELGQEEMVLNMGPQHPSTHGVMRLELVTDGEVVRQLVPHIGYMHRCFEKHAESLTYPQIIPYVDRLDYVAAINSEHAYAMGVERMLDLTGTLPKRVEYVRVLVAELNRIASHLLAIGTYGVDLGATTAFLWCMRDREHILNLLEWASGARMLYNYIWVGGLFYDLPVDFEERALEFAQYFAPKLDELDTLLTTNTIFIQRTANIGILPLSTALNYGITGPMLRASGLKYDLRKVDGYSVYPELQFEIPIGQGLMGTLGDCWDRYYVRAQEMRQSLKLVQQCAERLLKDHVRTPDFDPRKLLPRKTRPKAQEFYCRAENPRGELGFYFIADGKSEQPFRCKARGPSFCNLSVLPELCRDVLLADVVAIVGSVDVVMCEVDR